MLLNYGHTLAHGVEKCSGYQTPHGMAVAMGMAVITKAAEALGQCEKGITETLINVLKKYDLPVEIPYSAEDIAAVAKVDKKNTGSTLHIIVPEEIGHCVIRKIASAELLDWVHAGGLK